MVAARYVGVRNKFRWQEDPKLVLHRIGCRSALNVLNPTERIEPPQDVWISKYLQHPFQVIDLRWTWT